MSKDVGYTRLTPPNCSPYRMRPIVTKQNSYKLNSWSDIGLMKAYSARSLLSDPVAVDASPIVPVSSLEGKCKMRRALAICCSISTRRKFSVSIGGLTNLRYSPLSALSPSLSAVLGLMSNIPVGLNLLFTPEPLQLEHVRYPPFIGSKICPS